MRLDNDIDFLSSRERTAPAVVPVEPAEGDAECACASESRGTGRVERKGVPC